MKMESALQKNRGIFRMTGLPACEDSSVPERRSGRCRQTRAPAQQLLLEGKSETTSARGGSVFCVFYRGRVYRQEQQQSTAAHAKRISLWTQPLLKSQAQTSQTAKRRFLH
jgi:hypothetical protein